MAFKEDIERIFKIIKSNKNPISLDQIHNETGINRIKIIEIIINLEETNRIKSKFYIERTEKKTIATRRYSIRNDS